MQIKIEENRKNLESLIDEGAEISLLTYFNFVQATRSATAGNGRLVRNKIEEAILNQSRRLVAEPDADLSLLTSRDFDLSDIGPMEVTVPETEPAE